MTAVSIPIALTARDAAALVSVSERTWRRWDSAGLCPAPIRVTSGCVRWDRQEVVDWWTAGAPARVKWEQLRLQRTPALA